MVISTVVVDASLALKWILEEPFSEEARELLLRWKEDDVKTIAPGLLPYEVTNVLYERVKRGEINLEEAHEGLAAIMDAGPVLLDYKPLHAEALRLARILGRSTSYDTHYLALAEKEDCVLWTADESFYNATKDAHSRVRWVGEATEEGERGGGADTAESALGDRV